MKVKILVITNNFPEYLRTRPTIFHDKFDPVHVTSEDKLMGYTRETKLVLYGLYDLELADKALERYPNFMRIA